MGIKKDDLKQRNNNSVKAKAQAAATGMALTMLCAASVQADDMEIYSANVKTSSNANIVFVLDTSGSMDDPPKNGSSNKKKIEIVKDVFHELIYDPTNNNQVNPKYKNLNLALMRFDKGDANGDNSDGGYFLTPMDKLNGNTAQNTYWNAVKDLQAAGWTPLAETAYEAFLYFNGKAPNFGSTSKPGTNDPDVLTDDKSAYAPLAPENNSPNTNKSQCTLENHLVILTDGMPTKDGDADSLIKDYTKTDCSFSNDENCLVDLAFYMKNTDDDGIKEVTTHTIAFDLGNGTTASAEEKWLASVAAAGGGMAVNSTSHDQLIKGIEDILKDVINSARTSVSPAMSLSASNNYVHDNTLYYALYQPSMTPKWYGNFKAFRMDSDGILRDYSAAAAKDSKAVVSTSNQTVTVNNEQVSVKIGEIMPDVTSKWSDSVDGNKTTAGGAASEVTLSRNNLVWTQSQEGATGDLVKFDTISAEALQVPANEKDTLIGWTLGKAIDQNGELQDVLRDDIFGDPVHSTPQVINYGGSIGAVGVFATNEGFLHAFQLDANNGEDAVEKFSFIPYALLKNLKEFMDKSDATKPHKYGLDGYISALVRDNNSDGKITASGDSGDKVIIIVGMRRGGDNYYAVDATDLNNPKLLWQISGGDEGFEKLGQTWSKPVITRMHKPGAETPTVVDVVLFTGGYDPGYDKTATVKYPVPNNPTGNAIFAVELDGTNGGKLVWSSNDDTSLAEQLNHAMPAGLTAVDVTQDKVIDVIYAIDIMGRIYRVDLNTTNYVPEGQLFADLSGDNRRFYNAVNVAYSFAGVKPYFHINVGSGFRAHPLDLASNDLFYSVLDESIFTPLPENFTAIKASDLTDKTTPNNNANDKGWFFKLDFSGDGEKVLSKATTRGGYVFFTTYLPPTNQEESCAPPLGRSYTYAVSLSNGDALDEERHVALQANGIAPPPNFLTLQKDSETSTTEDPFTSSDSKTFVIVGTEKVPFSDEVEDKKLPEILDRVAEKIYWTQQ